MTRLMKTVLFLFTLLIFSGNFLFAASLPGEVNPTQAIGLKDSKTSILFFLQLKPKEIEKLTGHRLTIREKIAFKIYKLKLLKKISDDDLAKKKKFGKVSLWCGIGAFVLVFIPVIGILSIPAAIAAVVFGAISLNGNNNTNGIIGLILGGSFIVLFLIAVILVVAFFSSF